MAYLPDDRVAYLVQHYSATPVEKDFTAADIDAMHKRRGFNEIGYHYFIRKNGIVETGRDLSQPGRFEQGAHSKGENDVSIGICLEGGVRRVRPNEGFDSRTSAQIKAQIKLIRELLLRFPNAKVIGHRDMPFAATQCPGYNAGDWWETVKTQSKPKRKSAAKSTTVQASAVTIAGGAGAGITAISALDTNAQYIVLAFAGVIVLAGLWIMRERLRKWAEGDK